MNYWRRLIAIAVIMMVGFVLVGCGDSDSEPTPTVTVAPTSTIESTPTEKAPTAASAPVSPLAIDSPLPQPVSASAINSNDSQADYVPSAGKSGIQGRLISTQTGQPLNHEVVRLAEVVCLDGHKSDSSTEKCVYMLDNAFSPSTFTDPNGYFEFRDVDVLPYAILVGDMIGKYALVNDTGKLFKKFDATDGAMVDVGELQIDY